MPLPEGRSSAPSLTTLLAHHISHTSQHPTTPCCWNRQDICHHLPSHSGRLPMRPVASMLLFVVSMVVLLNHVPPNCQRRNSPCPGKAGRIVQTPAQAKVAAPLHTKGPCTKRATGQLGTAEGCNRPAGCAAGASLAHPTHHARPHSCTHNPLYTTHCAGIP